MPVSIVVGGQFGSEGKGKVALEIARRRRATAVVRVGGTNSGHTGVDDEGRPQAFRQLPASALADGVTVVLPAGAIIDPSIFLDEVRRLGLGPDHVLVSGNATVITQKDKDAEREQGLVGRIGSTGSGTGAALARRMARDGSFPILAEDVDELAPFIRDTEHYLTSVTRAGERIVIEGTQGFGLSLLLGRHPKVTSRSTTAAAFLDEAGLSPFDVDDITLVVRTYPIRVAGDSGLLPNETTWEAVATRAGLPSDFVELTTATRKVRRVAEFDPEVVRRAIRVNRPTRLVLNHLDYVDPEVRGDRLGAAGREFVAFVERSVGHTVHTVGTGPAGLLELTPALEGVSSK